MNDYKIWIISLCIFSIVTSVILNILPETNTKKYFGYALSVIFVFILINPLLNGDISNILDYSAIKSFDLIEDSINSNTQSITDDYLEQILNDKFNIDTVCNVKCEYNGNIMNIVEIEIFVTNDKMIQKIFDYIKDITGVEPNVKVEEVENDS